MYLSWYAEDYDAGEEVPLACPLISRETAIISDWAYVFFDTEAELDDAFDLTVGDDGPTPSNRYDGEARVYALTCSNTGQILTENT